MEIFKCLYCKKEFNRYKSLSMHTHRMHKILPKDFYTQYYLNGKYPTCKCGCGEYTTWKFNYYADYIRGHISRIHNNWGNNPKAMENSAKTRREIYIEPWNKGKTGLQEAWNKGLTKEIDDRVKKSANKLSEVKREDEKNNERLAKMSRNYWANETHREEQSERLRIITIKRIEGRSGQISPNYNPKTIPIIEEYGMTYGYNFRHAENGGEVCIGGYFPDGCDEKRKTLIEIDEKHHFDKHGKLKQKDIKRQKFLENKGYKVIRIKYVEN